MLVKPNAGRAVRDPVKGTLLPESGAEVPDNSFWRRRLRDEDVSLITATPLAATPAASNTAPSATTTATEDTK